MYHNLCMKHNRWWRDCVGYVIYPQAYLDSNDDGIGDLRGIESKLDYLRDLGINLIWLGPIFKSPMEDNGYDVSDYLSIAPEYGTMDDLKHLIDRAHELGIKIILDLPLAATSDEHPWFQMAIKDPDSAERGYYFFRKGKLKDGKLVPPNNWASFNSIPAWTKVPDSDEYYLHIFAEKQPDLNWSNPAVRKSMADVALFYLNLGADGFRIDAMAHLSKDMSFSDSNLPDNGNGFVLDTDKFSNRPEVGEYLKEFSDALNADHDPCLIGEAGGGITPENAARLASIENGPVSMIFNFDTVWNNGAFCSIDKKDEEIKTDLVLLKSNFLRWYEKCHGVADMPLYWCDHDHPRVLSQYGSEKYRNESAKCLLTTLLFLYGTPFIYYGDEIGMSNVTYDKPEDFFSDSATRTDVAYLRSKGYGDEQITHYLNRCSRVNSRTPMQWDRGENAGFSKKGSVNKVNGNYLQGINIYDQMRDPWSILNFYQYAIWKRRDALLNDAVINGTLEFLDFYNPDVFAYRHVGASCELIVVSNFTEKEVDFPFYHAIGEVILQNYDNVYLRDHTFHLRPFESFLLRIRNDE